MTTYYFTVETNSCLLSALNPFPPWLLMTHELSKHTVFLESLENHLPRAPKSSLGFLMSSSTLKFGVDVVAWSLATHWGRDAELYPFETGSAFWVVNINICLQILFWVLVGGRKALGWECESSMYCLPLYRLSMSNSLSVLPSRNILFPWLAGCPQGHTLSIADAPFPSLALQIIPWPSSFSRADNQGEFSLLPLLTRSSPELQALLHQSQCIPHYTVLSLS